MSSIRDIYDETVRILILRFLDNEPAGALPAVMLADALKASGTPVSSERAAAHLEWLDEQRLVDFDKDASLPYATITKRGSEVAQGVIAVSGVRHPRKL